ncbi:MAG TPA: 50S ribosomal protein L32e [Candidatus Woesearchaeota archaeon]|mgnify:CR=1 FL=1|nr:50S ribosomal protein L32e [Candidatus Woesearchaeota archaeon]
MKKLVRMRRKKPTQLRLNTVRAGIKEKWKKPKGKFGRRKKVLKTSKGEVPKQGRRMPNSLRGLHPSGMEIIEVENVLQLNGLDPKTQGVKIRKVGNKKRIEIIKKAIEQKLVILNVRKPEEKLKSLEKPKKTKKTEDTKKEKVAEKKSDSDKTTEKESELKKEKSKGAAEE